MIFSCTRLVSFQIYGFSNVLAEGVVAGKDGRVKVSFETRAKLADGGRANRLVIEKFMQIYSTLSTFWAVLPCVDGARECAQTERRQSTNRLKRAKWWPQPDQAEEGGKN